jgi:hypothetical protein
MNATHVYSYRFSGRSAATISGLIVSIAMLAIAAAYAAPWYFVAPAVLSALMLIWAIARNPQSGCDLDRTTLHFFTQAETVRVHLTDIVSMKVTRWSDGPDSVTLTLASGDKITVPSMCADSKLAVTLKELGVVET